MLVCAANGAFVETRGLFGVELVAGVESCGPVRAVEVAVEARGLFGVELVAGDESCGTARAVDVDVDEGLELLVGDELGG